MKVICAWCKKDLGTEEGPEDQISHGMCDECKVQFDEDLKKLKEERDKNKKK